MDCKIQFNERGEKIGVYEMNSTTPSQTFQDILNNAQVKNFDEALEIYKNLYSDKVELPRVADKLPLTLSVFDNKSFVEMRGKQVNPITVQQILNGGGIKQIEKDLIKQIIQDNYQGQKKISYDELEATVRANIMPLERITTSSYADYGMDNLGNGSYGEAKTLILNAPIEHGVTGHFSGDFKASGRKNIKYTPKQLDANTWVAVEEGYEANANDNNIYQYVGTAGTKEAVDSWIENYENPERVNNKSNTKIVRDTMNGEETVILLDSKNSPMFTFKLNEFENENDLHKQVLEKYNGLYSYPQIINKGMFGHIRVWQDGEVFIVSELQSDYFQKNNARKDILDKATRNSDEFGKLQQAATIMGANFREEKAKLEEQNKKELLNFAKKQPNIEFKLEKTFNDDEKYNLRLFIDNKQIHTYRYKFSENQNTEEAEKEIISSTYTVGEYLPQNVVDYKKELENKVLELENKFDKDKNDLNKKIEKIKEGIFNKLSPQEKQFIASQKEWEKRMVREAIKEASLSGATSLRFPTPYTLSIIEGYVTNEKQEQATPYNFNGSADTILRVGETVTDANEYDELVVVNSTQNNITVKNLNDGISGGKEAIYDKVLDQLIRAEVFSNADSESRYAEFQKNNEVFKAIPYSVMSSEDTDFVEKVVYRSIEDANLDIKALFDIKEDNTLTRQTFKKFVNQVGMYDSAKNRLLVWGVGARETTFGQPYTYKDSTKGNFNISDLSNEQQTVARKYEEIAEILKKEKTIEVVTDENGFDWYEAPITQADIQKPVVAFSIIGQKGAQNLDKIEEVTFRLDNLEVAKKMQEKGENASLIKLTTNWELNGVDNLWRYEVPDGSFKKNNFEIEKEYKLSEVIKDNPLVEAYNDDITVKFYDNRENTTDARAGFNPIERSVSLYLNTETARFSDKGVTLINDSRIFSSVLHELTHAVQYSEGFGVGGNTNTVLGEASKLIDLKNVFTEKEALEVIDAKLSENINDNDKKLLNTLKKYLETPVLYRYNLQHSTYEKISGEVEARSVQQRYENLGKTLLLADTLGISPEDQFFIKNNLEVNNSADPKLTYKLNDKFYNSYKEALRSSQGEQVEIGVQTVNGFVALVTVETNTDLNRKEGLINNLIKSNLLSGDTYTDNKGRKIFQVEGKSKEKRIINSVFAKKEARQYQGTGVKSLPNGDIYFDNTLDKDSIEIVNIKGERQVLKKKDLEAMSFKEMEAKFDDPIGLLASIEYKNAIKTYSDSFEVSQTKIVPENELQEKLVSLLKNMGIKTLDMQTYIDNYATKNGVEPSATALADLTQKIIAFKDGIINANDLNEEVAHFIIASTPKAEIENLLRNIHKTPEWLEFSKAYMDIYGDEALVREEILGKVLANALQRNFEQKENSSEIENNIINRIKDIFNKFFDKIQAFFKDSFRVELNDYLDSVYANLMQDTLLEKLDMSKFENRRDTLYSVDTGKRDVVTQLYNKSAEAISNINVQQQQLSRKGDSSLSRQQINKAKELLKKEDTVSKMKAMTTMALVARKQIEGLERAVNKKKEGQFPFTQEENAVYELFKNSTAQILSEVNALMTEQDNSKEYKEIKKSIKDTLTKFDEVRGIIGIQDSNAILNLVDKLQVKHNLTEAQKQNLLKAIQASQQDTNTLHAYLGSLTAARSPLLNLAGDIISTTNFQARQGFLEATKPFLQKLEDLKILPKELKTLINGKYLVNDIDNVKLDDFQQKVRERAFKSVTGKEYSEEEYKNLTLEEAKSIETRIKYDMSEVKEQFFTDEYINEQEELFKDLPESALEFHKKDRAQRAEIRTRATKNGITIYDASDKVELEELTKIRNQASNYYYANGELKQGLTATLNNEGKYDITLDENSSNEDGEIALGLNKISEIIRKKVQGGNVDDSIPQSFLDMYNSLQGQEKSDFLFLNAYVGFNDEFWDSFGERDTMFKKLTDSKDGVNDETIDELIENILIAQQKIAYITKSSRTFNQPAETNANSMSSDEKGIIKSATEDLEYLYSRANLLLPKEERVEVDNLFDVTANQAFKDEIEDRGLEKDSEVLEFILQNVTDNNKRNINIAIDIANKLKKSLPVKIPVNLQSIFTEGVDADLALIQYAQSKLLSYYKRTEPQGYTELLEQLNSGQISLEQFANDDRVKVNPNFSFYDNVNNTNINPNFLENKQSGRLQIKKGAIKLKSGEIVNFDSKEFENIKKNPKLFGAWQALVELQKATLSNYGLTDTHNIYKLPQIGKRGFRQTQDIFQKFTNPKVWKEALADLTTFREDESELGQDYEGKSASRLMASNVIPVYYTRDLSNQEDLSDELVYTYSLMNQQSALYNARVNNIGDMLAVKKAIEDTTFENKSAQASNTYKMFKSFLDYNFFGVKENLEYSKNLPFIGRVDLAKVLQKFVKYTSAVNITGLTIPITNFAQNFSQKTVERIVGERFDSTARKLGNQEAKRLMSSYVGEMMSINTKSEMGMIMEAFQQDNIVEDKLKNSSFSKYTRGLGKLPNIANEIFSLPIVPSTVLTVLNDNRYVNGKILTFNQYKTLNRTLDSKQLKINWEKEKLVYEDRQFKDGQFSFNKDKVGLNLNMQGEELDKYLQSFMEGLSTRIKTTVNDIDLAVPQEEKSILGRNAMANVILMHRGWLLVASQRRFSSGHLNLSTGMWQEGIYSTLGRFISDITAGATKKNGATYLQHVKNMWQGENLKNDDGTIDLDRLDNQKRNLIRVGAELAVINGMFALAMLLSGLHEDDDRERDALDELVDIAYYFTYRATNEVSSATSFLPLQYYGVAKSPVISLQMMNNVASSYEIFSGEEVKSGTFTGFTKSQRKLIQLTPLAKDFMRLTNIQKSTNSYKHFNDFEALVPLSYLFTDKEEK